MCVANCKKYGDVNSLEALYIYTKHPIVQHQRRGQRQLEFSLNRPRSSAVGTVSTPLWVALSLASLCLRFCLCSTAVVGVVEHHLLEDRVALHGEFQVRFDEQQ